MIVTVILWGLGGLLTLLGLPVVVIGLFSRDVRESHFGGETWRVSIVFAVLGLVMLWTAWHR